MSRLKTLIDANIKENGNQEITGNVLNYVLTEIADEVKREGYFPDMSVGFADNLVGRGESVPAEFTFRASGGKSIKDGAARIKRIKGNSVVWNQNRDTLTPTNYFGYNCISQGNKVVLSNVSASTPDFGNMALVDGFIPIVGHKYMLLSDSNLALSITSTNGFDVHVNAITQAAAREYSVIYLRTNSAPSLQVGESISFGVQIIDLTLMFRAGNEPTTIEEYNARKPIVADEYAYNEGEVIHMNTESIKSVGDNAWDEQWEEGIVDEGNNYFIAGYIRSKNYIKVLPDAQYHYIASKGTDQDYIRVAFYNKVRSYLSMQTIGWNKTFTIPSNAHYVRFYVNDTYGSTYKHDIMLTLVHSGWKQDTDAGYQPYWQDTLPLPIIRKYFPDGMKSAGSAHDEIRYNKANGKWEKVVRIGSVDLGTFDYNLDSRFDNAQFYCDTSLLINNNIRCGRYITIEGGWDTNKDKTITRISGGQILIVDSAYTDAASFKAAMQGVMLYYELAEPVIREIDEPIGTDYRVADFGTEQAISSIPSAPFSADIIYQFNAVDMIRELWLKVQELESRVAQL